MNDAVARALACYAALTSYRDIGEASVTIARGPKPWQRSTLRYPFQTAFVRPARLLFEWKVMGVGPHEEWPHAALWRNSRGLFAWETSPERADATVTSPGSIAAQLEHWSASCGGASLLLPRLLGLVEGEPPLEGLQLVGEDEVDGQRAFRLERALVGGVFVAWIGAERPLVLRTFQRLRHSPERDAALRQLAARAELPEELRQLVLATPQVESDRIVETTTFLRPQVDLPIDDSAFDLSPSR